MYKTREEYNAYMREWYRKKKQDPKYLEDYRKKHNKWAKESVKRKRAEIVKLLGGKCVRCGFSDSRALQIDHVYGSGRRHAGRKHLKQMGKHGCRKNSGIKNYSGYLHKILKEIKSGSKDYQLLCANCNWIKRAENKEYGNWKGEKPKL